MFKNLFASWKVLYIIITLSGNFSRGAEKLLNCTLGNVIKSVAITVAKKWGRQKNTCECKCVCLCVCVGGGLARKFP